MVAGVRTDESLKYWVHDGAAVLWHNPKSGELYLWYTDGLVARAGGYLGPSRFGDAR